MQLTSRAAGAVLAAVLAFALAEGTAAAYPHFQLSTGNTRCNLCHIAPAGGGLLNDYGRGEAGDTISQFGGNGAFLYGLYDEPDWLKLGVDLRGAVLAREASVDPEYTAFPMQGDTYVFLKARAFSFYGVVGPRAQVRPPRDSFVERLTADEYWVMWRPRTTGWYARAGRFYAPFGLRSQDHTQYVRRYLGFHTYEETYNVSAGTVSDQSELHVTAFMPVPAVLLGNGPSRRGAAALWERRALDDKAVLGAQARAGFGPDDRQYLLGGIGKYWMEPAQLLLQAELDVGYQDFTFGAAGRPQLAGLLSASYWPLTGLLATAQLERFDEDISVEGVARDAGSLHLQYFPLAHWELHLFGKLETQGDYSDPTSLAMLQLHYYL